jgi:hypothetical protein
MRHDGIYYGHLEYITVILLAFGNLVANLVYFQTFW